MNFPVHFILILLKCSYLLAACPFNGKDNERVMGGTTAKPHSHPYMVSLQTRILYLRMHFCGGVLLNERFVLSAAHCVTESWLIRWLPLDAVAGIHGTNDFMARTQINQILDRIPHPLYNGGVGAHDIGLFRTVAPFVFTEVVQPIKLSTNFDYKSNTDSLKLVGWGALRSTMFIPDLPNGLQEVKVTYIPFADCYKAIDDFKEGNEINPLDKNSHLCTGPTTGGVAACVGDSGGPLIVSRILVPHDPVEDNTEMYDPDLYDCPNANKTAKEDNGDIVQGRQVKTESVLLGIVSWGISPCGEEGAPTVYTNVSSYKDFIDYNMKHW